MPSASEATQIDVEEGENYPDGKYTWIFSGLLDGDWIIRNRIEFKTYLLRLFPKRIFKKHWIKNYRRDEHIELDLQSVRSSPNLEMGSSGHAE